MLKSGNLIKLISISKETKIELGKLISTYTRKEIQYQIREQNTRIFENEKYGERAIRVMEEYARRKLNYDTRKEIDMYETIKDSTRRKTRKYKNNKLEFSF